MAALDRAGMPSDPAFREAVREHVEFGSRVAMQNSHAGWTQPDGIRREPLLQRVRPHVLRQRLPQPDFSDSGIEQLQPIRCLGPQHRVERVYFDVVIGRD